MSGRKDWGHSGTRRRSKAGRPPRYGLHGTYGTGPADVPRAPQIQFSAPPVEVPPRRRVRRRRLDELPIHGWMLLGGGVLSVVGFFFPWVTMERGLQPDLIHHGTDESSSAVVMIVLALVAVAAGVTFLVVHAPAWPGVLGALAALSVAATTVHDLVTLRGRIEAEDAWNRMDVGYGQIVVVIGAVTTCLGGVWAALAAGVEDD
ncbi:hypothetical protein ACPYO6_10520 [Georgenia sp. Z1344]|uniref:hypothetical protein n=1 Tax=Georgenia sp. Z1344 TaxID=3416706 RepID=UPI003CF18401